MKISGVLLAAGLSSRMGTPNKLLLAYNNHTILEEVITQLVQSKIEELFVITGHEHSIIEKTVERVSSEKITIIFNENYQKGRASSIQCAVNHTIKKFQALLFMVADKPMIQSSLIDLAIDTFEKEQPDILYVQTLSGRGHPIIFSQKLFPQLLLLDGDITGNSLVEKYKSSTIVIKDNATQIDIDTYDDYLSVLLRK